jgi:predicted DNA-binding transcriptional regulator YafY
MARTENQKIKLLYLEKLFKERSDENHPLKITEIIEYLAACGISSERKSLYGDIETLRRFGMDIVTVKSDFTGYYLGTRAFELAELKLLVDSVQSSKFITQKKTLSLIEKLEGLTSLYEAGKLRRQVYVTNRIKSMNESVYYNIDEIHNAISEDHKISFRYFEYAVTKTRRFRKGGTRYVVSPYALIWDSENYYLLAYDSGANMMKHYRVDKMDAISVEKAVREGAEQFAELDMSAYSGRFFAMFGGEEQTVQLEFDIGLVDAVIDRFGRDVALISSGESKFIVNLKLVVSPQFFGWLFAFGDGVKILNPDSLADKMREYLSQVSSIYG